MTQIYMVMGSVEDILTTDAWHVRAFVEMEPALALCKKLNKAVQDARLHAHGTPQIMVNPGDSERIQQGRAVLKAHDLRGGLAVNRGDSPDYDVQQCVLEGYDGRKYALPVPTGKKAIQL